MGRHIHDHSRATAFDDLLSQITGELALTPASRTWVDAPFIDVDPDPETSMAAAPLPQASARARRSPARGWLAGGLALLLAVGGFAMGAVAPEAPTVEALNLAQVEAESDWTEAAEARLEQMRSPAATVIPAAVLPVIPAAAPEPEPEPEPVRKTTTRRTTKKKTPAKPKVSFEDL